MKTAVSSLLLGLILMISFSQHRDTEDGMAGTRVSGIVGETVADSRTPGIGMPVPFAKGKEKTASGRETTGQIVFGGREDTMPVQFQTLLIVIVVVQAIVCAFLAGSIADKKGHDSASWALAGLFCGIFGLIAAAGLPDRLVHSDLAKKCADCAEQVRLEARKCPHCGHAFSEQEIHKVMRALIDKSVDQRARIMKVIADLPAAEAAEYWRRILQHGDPGLALDAARCLIKTENIDDVLVAYESGFATREAAQAILRLKDKAALPRIIQCLGSTNLAGYAENILLIFGNDAIDALRSSIQSINNSGLRKKAQSILRKLEKQKKRSSK